jgi:SAM-dependent methyltransferase
MAGELGVEPGRSDSASARTFLLIFIQGSSEVSGIAAVMTTASAIGGPPDRDRFVRFRTTYMFDRFIDLPRDRYLKILDFGCGEGHSLGVLLDIFPKAQFVGADIDTGLLATCTKRFGKNPRVTLIELSAPTAIGTIESDFDIIQLNAVFEHLLPGERKKLMPDLWGRLRRNGYLVLTETPWRWFPVETHTTSLPFVNYMPDQFALWAVRRRHSKNLSWRDALKYGVRGATVREIIACIGAGNGALERVQPRAPDARDMLEVWWRGDIRRTGVKALTYWVLRLLQRGTGIVLSPWVNLVLRKLA